MEEISIEMARKNVKLSQAEIANLLGVSRNTYGTWERYEVAMDIPTGYKFSKITGVPFDNIIFFKSKVHLKCRI